LLTPKLLETAKNMFEHANMHIAVDPEIARDPKKGKQEQELLGVWKKVIMQAEKALADQQAQAGTANPENMPAPVNGQPMQATGPNGGIEGEDMKLKAMVEAGDLAVRKAELEQRGKEFEHKAGVDRAKLVLEANKTHQSAIQQQVDQEATMHQASMAEEAVRQKDEANQVAQQDKANELRRFEQ
jgi:hypothetical protein